MFILLSIFPCYFIFICYSYIKTLFSLLIILLFIRYSILIFLFIILKFIEIFSLILLNILNILFLIFDKFRLHLFFYFFSIIVIYIVYVCYIFTYIFIVFILFFYSLISFNLLYCLIFLFQIIFLFFIFYFISISMSFIGLNIFLLIRFLFFIQKYEFEENTANKSDYFIIWLNLELTLILKLISAFLIDMFYNLNNKISFFYRFILNKIINEYSLKKKFKNNSLLLYLLLIFFSLVFLFYIYIFLFLYELCINNLILYDTLITKIEHILLEIFKNIFYYIYDLKIRTIIFRFLFLLVYFLL